MRGLLLFEYRDLMTVVSHACSWKRNRNLSVEFKVKNGIRNVYRLFSYEKILNY